jgi:hypothetical protein
MPQENLERLWPHLEPVDLVLAEPVPVEHVYFHVAGMI